MQHVHAAAMLAGRAEHIFTLAQKTHLLISQNALRSKYLHVYVQI